MPCVSPYFRGRVLCLLQTCTGVTGIARAIGNKHLMLHLLHRRFQQSGSTRDNLWPWKPKQKLHLHLRAGLFVYVSNGIYFFHHISTSLYMNNQYENSKYKQLNNERSLILLFEESLLLFYVLAFIAAPKKDLLTVVLNSMTTLMVEAWLFLIELHLVSFRINMA